MKKSLILTGLATLAVTPAFALEQTVDLKFQGLGAGRNGSIKFDSAVKNLALSQQRFSFSNATPGSAIKIWDKTVQNVYCVDLSQWTDTKNTQQYTIISIDGLDALKGASNKTEKVAGMYRLIRSTGGSAFKTADNDYAAAYQMLTWDILYDFDGTSKSLDLNAGRFQKATISSGVANKYNELRSAMLAQTNGSAVAGVYALKNACNQDYIAAVPEPGSVAALGLGAAAMIFRKRRAKK